ncbi:uncharacterized protein [Aegilops tauschii subsp. strangulata]|uniref:uncharacterized protein isoform X4 n=1 Tax=Aegilops tauschii subsp. strangulata TaxID=200361 RepID=UPI00098A8501|nr:uncharacterized protein LOC109751239 isoform X6 [Aegilops tauschii subsp. strangulata]
MATELAADDPPVVHLRATGEALATDMADEHRAGGEGRGMTTVYDLCTTDKRPSRTVPTVDDLCAANKPTPRVVPTVPEFPVAEELPNPELLNKDTIPEPLESNNNSKNDGSGDDSMDEQEEQSIVDMTESDASDGILIDGLRTFLQKRQERKQERSALKEKRKKRTRPEKGKAKGHMNKGRATAYSRFSIGYFAKIVDVVCQSNHRMEVVRNGGFGYLLELEDCYVPRPFAQWVADNISTKEEAIVLGGKSVPLNPEAVSLVLGIPAGRTKIRVLDEESGKAEFLSLFGLTDLPSISFFRNKLMKEELPDDVYLRCFLTVALATFLCPTSNTKPSTKYLGALVDVSKYKDLYWCSFVHTWNISYVKKYQSDKLKEKRITTTLGGCIYQLAVRCLDFNNFGSITIPPALQTIKHFSDMLLGKDGLYGALQIKDEAETCYAQTDGAWASTSKNSNIRKAIHRVLGNSFPEKERVKDQNLSTCLIAKQVLLDTLNIVSSSFDGSQHTEKLESSDHLYMPTNEDNGSGSTIRVDSNGIEINSDGRGRKKRMKTSTQQSETSTTKDNILEVKIKGSRLEAAVEGGEAEMQSVPGNGHTKELQKEVVMEQTMQNSNVATQQPEMNMLDADTNFPKCNASDCSTQKEAPEKSTSLNYMLLSARLARALETTEQDMNSKDEASTHVPPTFSGFQHNAVNSNQSEHCTESKTMYQANKAAAIECVELDTTAFPQDNNNQDDFRFNEVREQGKHAGLDIDINIPLSNSGIDDKHKHVEDFQHTMHPLDIARQKYFFFDDMAPSCRIFVDHDDCGNEITEPELWRDLDMDSNAYEVQIEEAKKKYKSNTSKDIIKGFSSQHEQTAQGDSSIHCAQKEPATTEMCKYRNFLPGFEEIDDIIDLTSPAAHTPKTWDNAKTCYYPMRTRNYENYVSSSQKNKKSYLTTPFIGKRLFTDEVIEEDDQDGTKDQPIPVIDELQLSPDVQILGERVFNGSCSNMVNTADNL